MWGWLDGWLGHMLVLGLSTTDLTDIFNWLVSLIDDNTQPNRQQHRVKFLVHPFSMLAAYIPGGSACWVVYLLHIVCTLLFVKLTQTYLDHIYYYYVRKMLPCIENAADKCWWWECFWWRIILKTMTDRRIDSPSKHSSWWRRLENVFSLPFLCLSRRTS